MIDGISWWLYNGKNTLSEKKQQDVRPIVYGRTKLWLKKETAGSGGLK